METFIEPGKLESNPEFQKQKQKTLTELSDGMIEDPIVNVIRGLLEKLQTITSIDPENIQYCSARWFWRRQVNSYVLQVEPDRFKHKDKAILDYKEALYIENLRGEFFRKLEELLLTP